MTFSRECLGPPPQQTLSPRAALVIVTTKACLPLAPALLSAFELSVPWQLYGPRSRLVSAFVALAGSRLRAWSSVQALYACIKPWRTVSCPRGRVRYEAHRGSGCEQSGAKDAQCPHEPCT